MSAVPHVSGAELVTDGPAARRRADMAVMGFLARYRVQHTRYVYGIALKQWFSGTVTPGEENGSDGATAEDGSRVVGSAAPAERARVSAVAAEGRPLRQVVLAGRGADGAPGGVPARQRLAAPGPGRGAASHLRHAPVLRAHPPTGRVSAGERPGPRGAWSWPSSAGLSEPVGQVHRRAGAGDPCPARRGGVVPVPGASLRDASAEHRPDLPARGVRRRRVGSALAALGERAG